MKDITGNNAFVMENTLLPPLLIPKKYILSRNVLNKIQHKIVHSTFLNPVGFNHWGITKAWPGSLRNIPEKTVVNTTIL